MLRRAPHGPPEVEQEREHPASPPAPPLPAILGLQRSAGNAAVSGLLARQPLLVPPPLWKPPELDPAVESAVDKWLADQKAMMTLEAAEGRLSMPEVIDRVRRWVPSAAAADTMAIRFRVNAILGHVPDTRTKATLGGQKAEMEARLSNLFPTPPTSVTFGSSTHSVTLGINGAQVKIPGTTYKATPEGPSVETKDGSVKVGTSGSWDGKSFGIKTEVNGVKLSGKVKQDAGKWSWSAGLTIPIAGEEVDEYPDVGQVVSDTHDAITESVGHVRGGGSPTDSYVRDRLGKVKPAIDAASRIAKRADKPSVTLRVKASGDDQGGWTVGASVVIEF